MSVEVGLAIVLLVVWVLCRLIDTEEEVDRLKRQRRRDRWN